MYLQEIGCRIRCDLKKGTIPTIFPFKKKTIRGGRRFLLDHNYAKLYDERSCRKKLFEENVSTTYNKYKYL